MTAKEYLMRYKEGVIVLDKKQLKAYQTYKRLIERNTRNIELEENKEIEVVQGKVKSSMKDFPYIESHAVVQMNEPVACEQRDIKIKKWQRDNEDALKQMQLIEQFVDDIKDVSIREIFVYMYIDGKPLTEVANMVGYSKSRVSQIITEYLKN